MIDYRKHARAIAVALLGHADALHSTEKKLRFGNVSVDLDTLNFYNFVDDEGGTLQELVAGTHGEDAGDWLRELCEHEDSRDEAEKINLDLPNLDSDFRDVTGERDLLAMMIMRPAIYDDLIEDIDAIELSQSVHREIFHAIADARQNDTKITVPSIVAACGLGETSVVPGFNLTRYLARILVDASTYDVTTVRDLAKDLRDLAEARERSKDMMDRPDSKYGAMTWDELDDAGDEHEFVIDGVFTKGDLSMIGGEKGSGKSFLAIHAGLCVATETQFFGRKVMLPGLVIYQAGEGARGVKKRMRAWRQHHKIPKTSKIPFLLWRNSVDLYRPDVDVEAIIKESLEWSDFFRVPLRMMFFDTFSNATAGADENSGKDMSTVFKNCKRIKEGTGANISLVHHMNAGGTKLRGHTSIGAGLDQILEVTKDEVTKIKTAVLAKQKDEEDGVVLKFKLPQVILGTRADGKPITSCIVKDMTADEAEVAAQEDRGIAANPAERAFYNSLLKALREKGLPPPAGCGAPYYVTTVANYDDVKENFRRSQLNDGADDPKKEAGRLSRALERARKWFSTCIPPVIGVDNPYIWRTSRQVRGFPKEGFGRDRDAVDGSADLPYDANDAPLPEGTEFIK